MDVEVEISVDDAGELDILVADEVTINIGADYDNTMGAESDPTVPNWVKNITQLEINKWNTAGFDECTIADLDDNNYDEELIKDKINELLQYLRTQTAP